MPALANKKIALVTGANKGIGFEIARKLAQKGVHVILGARDASRAQEAAKKLAGEGLETDFVLVDLDSLDSINSAAKEIGAKFDHLDILVNNAAIIAKGDTGPLDVDPEILSKSMQTNFIGTVAVTQSLIPLMKKAPSGSIVNVSSPLGSLNCMSDLSNFYSSTPYLGYSSTKAALNMFAVTLGTALKDTKIVVNSVSPGYCATDLNGNSGYLTAEEGARLPTAYALQVFENEPKSNEFAQGEEHLPW